MEKENQPNNPNPVQQPWPNPAPQAVRPTLPPAQFGPLPSFPGGSARAPLPLGPRRVPKPRLHPPRRARSLARGPRPTLAHLAAAVSRPPAQHAGLHPTLVSLMPWPRTSVLPSLARNASPQSSPGILPRPSRGRTRRDPCSSYILPPPPRGTLRPHLPIPQPSDPSHSHPATSASEQGPTPPRSRCSLAPPPPRATGGAQPGVHEIPRARSL